MAKNWISKAVIFAAGAAIGGLVSAVVTRQLVDKTYRDAADEEIFEATKKYNAKIMSANDEIAQLKAKIARQKTVIMTLADQLRENNNDMVKDLISEDDDPEDDPGHKSDISKVKGKAEPSYERFDYTKYANRYSRSHEGDEPEEVEFDPEEEEEAIRHNSPRQIDEGAFSTTALDYGKEDLFYYLFDGKVISEDGEWIENYERLTGPIDVSGNPVGEEIYIRNDELAIDYHITFVAGFGEEAMSHTDIWDED